MSEDSATCEDLRLGWWLSSEEHDPRALVEHAVTAESAGFTTAMISDHLQPWVPSQAQSPHVWTTIGAIAQATSALEIGTGVTAMVERNSPIMVAQAAGTAGVLLEGRFFLGVGTGERLNEQAFGRRWPSSTERREYLAEAVKVLRALLKGEVVNHRGERWQVEDLRLRTLPSEPPAIYIASSGKRTATLAAEVGDGLIAVTPDARLAEVFRGAGGDADRCIGQLHVSVAATSEAALENAWRWWPNAVVPPALLSELASPDDFEATASAIGPSSVLNTIVCATEVGPIIAAVDRFAGAGFSAVYLHQIGPDQQRLLDLCTSELLPHYTPRG